MGVYRGWQKTGNMDFGCGTCNMLLDCGDAPIITKFDKNIFHPAIRQKRSFSVNCRHHRFQLTDYYVCTYK
jgi:hypothetical protein